MSQPDADTDPARRAPRHIANRRSVRWVTGTMLLGGYLRLIRGTSSVTYDPPGQWDVIAAIAPVILVWWHGQANLACPYLRRPGEWSMMTSGRAGPVMAALARSFGLSTIDDVAETGADPFAEAITALDAGRSLALAADVPAAGRQVSLTVIELARRSARPVFAFATASSRRRMVRGSRMQINYPFSAVRCVTEGPMWMTDPNKSVEALGQELAALLDRALARALAAGDDD